MIKKLGIAAVAVIAAGILAVAVRPAFAASGENSFSATLAGDAAFTSETSISFTGSGKATLMGRVMSAGNVVFTGSDSSCPGGITNVNTETLTDNDGETLTIASQDVGCPTGPGQFHGTGQWTVTGGTGRFDGAVGTGSADGYGDFNTGSFTMTLTGTLTLAHD